MSPPVEPGGDRYAVEEASDDFVEGSTFIAWADLVPLDRFVQPGVVLPAGFPAGGETCGASM